MKMPNINIQGQQLNKFAKPYRHQADKGSLSPIQKMSMASVNSMPTFKGRFVPKKEFMEQASKILKKIFLYGGMVAFSTLSKICPAAPCRAM